jgi:sulfur-oxidizing protein SoxZ
MATPKPRIRVPKSASVGEIIEIKTLISHPMESGQRKDRKTGEPIPRKIINKFTCSFNGEEVFSADLQPAISANPYLSFSMRCSESGTLEFTWVDDDGSVYSDSKELTVE